MATPAIIASSVAAGLAVTAAGLAYATMSPGSQVFGPTLVAPPDPRQVALTFDDGPNPAATPLLLEVLARHQVRATFFLIGNFVLREPQLTREIAAAGHAIGNHTMTHLFLPRRSAKRVLDELTRCNEALEQTLGQRIELFRPPHGGRSPAVFSAAAALGLEIVQWNLIVGDWSAGSAEIILDRLQRGHRRNQRRDCGTTVVLHDGGQAGPGQPRMPTVQAVDRWLTRLQLDGKVKFVTPPGWMNES
jgi:peptidoglycan/xylan/chitin deacetylase (PgdA/CDA1 family)